MISDRPWKTAFDSCRGPSQVLMKGLPDPRQWSVEWNAEATPTLSQHYAVLPEPDLPGLPLIP